MSNDPITRLNAALDGRYAIEGELGEGGMANVYLAADLKHERKVALKVLKPELAAVVGAERFLAEIKTTANLQHPHILPLFDSGEADGFLFYVMPYVEGETLRDRLEREKQLPVDEAVRIASDVAEALHAAHEQGVIHRDVKPANILLSKGRPLVADFGIALAVSASGGGRLTETGLSMGTPFYMSPEQASTDREPTPASDVYSLACVLYEMLVGDPPHTASTAQAVLAKILTDQPPAPTHSRPSIPANVDAAIRRALEKLPADRFLSAEKFSEALANPAFGVKSERVEAPTSVNPVNRAMAGIAVTLALTSAFLWMTRNDGEVAPRIPVRFSIEVPGGYDMGADPSLPRLAVSPDGQIVVYRSDNRLYMRRVDELDVEALPDTEGVETMVFSPDSRSIGFTRDGGLLRYSLETGSVTEVPGSRINSPFGLWWDETGDIVYSLQTNGLWAQPEDGSEPTQLTVIDRLQESAHAWPQLLDDGSLLYTIFGPSGKWDEAVVVIEDLETKSRDTVLTGGMSGRYVPTGHVLHNHANGSVLALPYDLDERRATGSPVVVLPDAYLGAWGGGGSLAVSDAGTAALVPSPGTGHFVLQWFDRAGQAGDTLAGPATLSWGLEISPDDSQVLVADQNYVNDDVYVYDVATKLGRVESFGTASEGWGVWSPDGMKIIYQADAYGGFWDIRMKDVGRGTESDSLVFTTTESIAIPSSWSPDGRWLAATVPHPLNLGDVVAIDLDDPQRRIAVAETRADEDRLRFSPDGGWVSWDAEQNGVAQVFVATFPGLSRRQVTIDGGRNARWSSDGSELFFWRGETLMYMPVTTEPDFRSETPTELFTLPGFAVGQYGHYDATADGQRFLIQRRSEEGKAYEIQVIVNWFEELTERMGGN